MKCSKCGYENKDKAKFCTKCGSSLVAPDPDAPKSESRNTKYIIVALIAVIILLVGVIGYFALGDSGSVQSNDNSQSDSSQQDDSVDSSDDESDDSDDAKTESVSSSKSSSSKTTKSKSWESIGSYSGSGSGSETINVPEGKIMVKLSAYPIKNYATIYMYQDPMVNPEEWIGVQPVLLKPGLTHSHTLHLPKRYLQLIITRP